jgi:hypothetical protein
MIVACLVLVSALSAPAGVLAHCDGMDGPVVKGAQKAPHDQHKAEKAGARKDSAAHDTHPDTKGDPTLEFKIPESLKAEHEELHSELVKATAAGGRVGEAAKEVARLLHPHFVKEEEYAMPALGLLPLLAEGKITPDMAKALTMTDKLKADLPEMLNEHKAIVGALERLIVAAKAENKLEHAHFAEKLKLHAQTEEDVLYPASILIGEYLKLKLKQ